MEKIGLYSVKDNKVGVFQKPFTCRNDAEASRTLHSACQDPEIQLSRYPEDFDLYFLGTYNEYTGKLTQTSDDPRFVVGAISFSQLKKLEEKNGKTA